MTNEELVALLGRARDTVPDLAEPVIEFGEVNVDCPPEQIVEACLWLRENGSFELLADSSAVDWFGYEPPERRFCVSVQLASVSHPGRLRLRVWLPESEPSCPTLTTVWMGAEILEREMWDMFGISFEGHPNLTRVLMPDDWVGHPQRKDEPLGGIDVRYEHGQAVTAPDERVQRPTSTTGYPGRTS